MSATTSPKFAVIAGASSGIGLELTRQFAENGFNILIAADTGLQDAAERLKISGLEVISHQADLSFQEGVQTLYQAVRQTRRQVDALAANAGVGQGHVFFDQSREDWMKVIDTNIIGTLDLLHLVGRDMRASDEGRILITSSVVSQIPGAFQAVYNASKAFLQSF